MNKKKKGLLQSSFFISILIHGSLVAFIVIFPPTKSIIFQKTQKTSKHLEPNIIEKVLDEISIVQIPKKNHEESLLDLVMDESKALSIDDEFFAHIDLRNELTESINIELPIDQKSEFQLASLEKIDRSLESFLTPLSSPISEDLLSKEDPIPHTFSPKAMAVEKEAISPTIAELDDFNIPSYSKALPDVLETDLYAFTDTNDDRFFKMELKLKNHALLEEEPSDFLFIIDCTTKNAKKLIDVYKESLLKSIKSLKKHDRFNVYFLNKNLNSIFEEAQNYTVQNHLLLEDELAQQPKCDGKMKDFVKNLGKVFDETESNLVHSHVIVFTEEPSKEEPSISSLSKYAHSKLSFYPVMYQETNKRPACFSKLVETLGGKLLRAPTKASLPRKFGGLLLDIKKTRLRNISISVQGDDGPLDFKLSEKTKEMTIKKPLKIFGKLKGTRNVKIQVSGTHGDDMYEMQKIIPVSGAKKGSFLIKDELEQEAESE